ncbi:MAG: hypothetical protein KC646_17900 [Candidatus Cloacimonetes bacterium]|nr:hypothetical protein [Candidatus Cloacimonadota bacterium]
MKNIKLYFILLVCFQGWGFSQGTDFFSDINSEQTAESNVHSSAQGAAQEQTSLSGGFWDQTIKKEDLAKFDTLNPKSTSPKSQDLRIIFDDRVVGTFSDHLLSKKLKEVYDIKYHVIGEMFRISVILDYQSMKVNGTVDNFLKPKGYDEKIANGNKYLIAVDLMTEVFSKEDDLDSLFLKVLKIDTYGFWKDGDTGKKDQSIKRFQDYVKASSSDNVASDFASLIEKMQEKIEKAQEAEDFKAAFLAQKSLSEIQELQKMETGFDLSPEFIGNSLKLLQSLDAISKLLNFEYTYYQSKDKKSFAHLIKVGDLSKVFQMALPDFRVNYVRVKESKVYFMGKVIAEDGFELK